MATYTTTMTLTKAEIDMVAESLLLLNKEIVREITRRDVSLKRFAELEDKQHRQLALRDRFLRA